MQRNHGTRLAFATPPGAEIIPADGHRVDLTWNFGPYGLPVYEYPVIRIYAGTRRHNVSALHVSVVTMLPNDEGTANATAPLVEFTLQPDSMYEGVFEVPGLFLSITVRSDVAEGSNAMSLYVYGYKPYVPQPACC